MQQMAERQRAQKKLHEQTRGERDRSARQRPADDNVRREQQRQQQQSAVRMESADIQTLLPAGQSHPDGGGRVGEWREGAPVERVGGAAWATAAIVGDR